MSYSRKIRLVIIIIVLVALCESKDPKSPAAASAAISDQQKQEIAKLRSDLNTAFEKDEQAAIATKGVVVQPGWTQTAKASKSANAKVEVTRQGLQEAKALRAEINKAIVKDEYVASVASTAAGDTKNVKELEKEFSLKEKAKDALVNMAPLQSAAEDEQEEEENVGGAQAEEANGGKNSTAGPNIVEANSAMEPDIDIRKMQRLEVSKRRTKEVLSLRLIEEDFSFNFGDDVLEWEHIMHNGSEYFVGRRQVDLLIVRKDTSKYEAGTVLSVGESISYLETYSFWNSLQQQQEGVILVASTSKIMWYRGNGESGRIDLYWEWLVGSSVSGLTHFTVESKEYMAVSSNESSRAGYYALNIYQFELNTKEFWISQRMQLKHPCNDVTVLDTGRDILLAIAQNNTADIYSFNPHVAGEIRFQYRRSFESVGIQSISGFQMGGRSYLALGGLQSQILLYEQGDLVPKTILSNNFGLVELFFPIPTRTYRDDLILLVQHRVDFDTHGLTVLETLIWDGEAFEVSIPVPCQLGPHTVYGVSCMLDIQSDEGLKGAALLRHGDEISVVVPRHKAESGLFRLHIELLEKNSELLDLQEIFAFLQDWVKEQDELVAKAQHFLGTGNMENTPTLPDLSKLETLRTPELLFKGNVGEIHINDYIWQEGDTQTDLESLMKAIEKLEQELSSVGQRTKRDLRTEKLTFDTLELNHLDVEFLNVEQLNNETYYIHDGSLVFDGILNLDNLEVLEEIISREVRQTSEATLEIDGNLEFSEINGIPWRDIKENLIFRSDPLELSTLAVEGEIVLEDRLSVEVLNALRFPDDYLWSSGPTTSIVTAEKVFTNTLAANAVDNDGIINGVNPFDAITLSEPQKWRGTPTFAQLEVSEQLELNGTAKGRGLDDFSSNPTLAESRIVLAACNFENLQVNGPIRVKGLFNGQDMKHLLSDIVQLPVDAMDQINITSRKTFTAAVFPVDFQVADSKVNGIEIEDFVTLHTPQALALSALEGYVYFHNLTVSGLYDGVDIEDFAARSLKIDAPQVSLGTQLNFVQPIAAKEFHILKRLNDVPIIEGYQTLHTDLVAARAQFTNLSAHVANIPNDIAGMGRLNGIDLQQFLDQRNGSTPKDVGNIFLDELRLVDALETDEVYGIDAKFFQQFLDDTDDLPEMILDGKIQVDHVIVSGDVQVYKLNGHNFDEEIQLTAVWLNRPNYLSTNLQFEEPLEVYGDLTILGDYNGVNLPTLLDDIVFRTDNTSTRIMAPKSFIGDVHVLGDTTVEAINGIPVSDIATTRNINNFKGSLQLDGNLFVDELVLAGNLNGYPVKSLSERVRFDAQLQAFVLLGETAFSTAMSLEDLTVMGDFNDIPKLAEFFQDLVYLDRVPVLRGRKTFTGRVKIEKGVYVGSLNNHSLLNTFNNIVFIRDAEPAIIQSPVIFKDSVQAFEVTIKESLTTATLTGCSLEEWLEETLRVDRDEVIRAPIRFGAGSLNGNRLSAAHLNSIDLSQVITLHSAQNFSSNLQFSEIYLDGEIVTAGPVNGVDLSLEYANTLMTYGNQHITTPLTIQSITVLQDLQTHAPVNKDKDLQQVATLHEDILFETPLFFQNVTARNIQTEDLISGINLEQWYKSALWLQDRPRQVITGNWTVRQLSVKSGPASTPNYMINGMPAWGYNDYMRTSRSEEDFEEISRKVTKLLAEQQRRPYFVKHLEKRFDLTAKEIDDDVVIRKAFVLQNRTDKYLLINVGCSMHVFQWNSQRRKYEKRNKFESGPIDQVVMLPNQKSNETLQFVTAFETAEPFNCTSIGLNAWAVVGVVGAANITHLRSFDHEPRTTQIAIKASRLYAIAGNSVQEFFTNSTNATRSYGHLPPTKANTSYHFVPQQHASSDEIILTNGEYIFLLNNQTTTNQNRTKRRVPTTKYSLPLVYQRAAKQLAQPTVSILKPDAIEARKLSYGDFKQVIERILTDLVYRLNLEVNITQLSIPESDLYDEHLVQDFIAIMEELHKQQIFPIDTFAAINMGQLKIPGNPAQVLAARTVQIIWPVIVEIEEVHNYLRDNATHAHPVCACITSSLGLTVRDVLLLANKVNDDDDDVSGSQDYTNELMAVIERIRVFQDDLDNLVQQLKTEIRDELNAANGRESQLFTDEDTDHPAADTDTDPLTNASLLSTEFSVHLPSNGSWLVLDRNHLPSREEGELLSLTVGPRTEPRHLLAVATHKSHLIAGQNDHIKLYVDGGLRGHAFQTIAAHKPHSLRSLRIRDESLLAYVEHCCTVHVLIYRGVQGFVKFAQFKTNADVKDLIVDLRLPNVNGYDGLGSVTSDDDGGEKYFLATVLQDKLTFYEIIVCGIV